MAAFEFKLPDIGEGVSEGEIVEWHVKAGDAVAEDDPMVEVMTDKATVTIGAPKTGTIQELRYDVGATAQVGAVIVVIETAGSAAAAKTTEQAVARAERPPAPASEKKESAATAVGDIRESLSGSDFFSRRQAAQARPSGNGTTGPASVAPAAGVSAPRGAAAPAVSQGTAYAAAASEPAPSAGGAFFSDKPLATPATRKLARDLGVDLRHVRPSGGGGRITKEDVHSFASTGNGAGQQVREAAGAAAPSPRPAAPAVAREPVRIQPGADEQVLEERKPFVGIRRKIAERMQTTKNTAAHFTFVEECDVGRLMELRNRLRPAAEAQGVKLSFLPFIVKAVVAALKRHPVLNSALDEGSNELVYRRYYHVGIAAATDAGLMVPVVRHADRRSLLDVAKEIDRLGEGARSGKLAPQDLTGSTFTITSLGKQGGLFATPILNFPEVGILGVHQIKQKPVVRDGEIVVGNVMLLSLSFDHRIVDGHVGAAFAYDIIAYLEDPDRLFLEMA